MIPEEHCALASILQRIQDPVVVELGAHDGSDSEELLGMMRGGRLVSVEADPQNFDKLAERHTNAIQTQHKWTVVHGAIADYTGQCRFFQTPYSGGGFGSIYAPGELAGAPIETFHVIYPIPCFTMDDFCCAQSIDRIDLLYVDIHGAEKDMILHGKKIIPHVHFMLMEVFNIPAYEGMATRADLSGILPGWTWTRDFLWNALLRNDGFPL